MQPESSATCCKWGIKWSWTWYFNLTSRKKKARRENHSLTIPHKKKEKRRSSHWTLFRLLCFQSHTEEQREKCPFWRLVAWWNVVRRQEMGTGWRSIRFLSWGKIVSDIWQRAMQDNYSKWHRRTLTYRRSSGGENRREGRASKWSSLSWAKKRNI